MSKKTIPNSKSETRQNNSNKDSFKVRETRMSIHQNKRKKNKNKKSKKSNRKKWWNWQRIVGLILILLAGALFALEPIKNMMVKNGIESAQIGNFNRQDVLNNLNKDVTFDLDEITYINPLDVITDGVNPGDLPVIGGIAIPYLDMNLPINKGTSNAGMYYGAGTVWKGQEMGKSNYVLASHHSLHPGLLFQPLATLIEDPEYYKSQNIKVYLTDLDKVYTYNIDYIYVVDPSKGEVMLPSEKPMITLITCTYDLNDRIIVQGMLEDVTDIELVGQEVIEAFNIEQTL